MRIAALSSAGRPQAAHHPAHRAGGVAVEFGVGDTRLLEIEHVEEVFAEYALRNACVGGLRGRGSGGTLSAATAATRSGCSSGAFHTTMAPQS